MSDAVLSFNLMVATRRKTSSQAAMTESPYSIKVAMRWRKAIDFERSSFRHSGFAHAFVQKIACAFAKASDSEARVERETGFGFRSRLLQSSEFSQRCCEEEM